MKAVKTLLRAMFAIAILGVVGCSTGYEIYDPPPREPAIPEAIIRTEFTEVRIFNATPTTLKMLRKDFENAPRDAQLSVNSIALYTRPDEIHFDHREAAHCHMGLRDLEEIEPTYSQWMPQILLKKSDICIDTYGTFNGLLRHEMTHAHVEGAGIDLDKFAEICAGKYVGVLWKLLWRNSEFPRDGFLHPYDTKDEYEHGANLVALNYETQKLFFFRRNKNQPTIIGFCI